MKFWWISSKSNKLCFHATKVQLQPKSLTSALSAIKFCGVRPLFGIFFETCKHKNLIWIGLLQSPACILNQERSDFYRIDKISMHNNPLRWHVPVLLKSIHVNLLGKQMAISFKNSIFDSWKIASSNSMRVQIPCEFKFHASSNSMKNFWNQDHSQIYLETFVSRHNKNNSFWPTKKSVHNTSSSSFTGRVSHLSPQC